MKRTRDLAFSAMATALAVVILLLGGWTGIGAYAAPMLAGVTLIAVGLRAGGKAQLLSYIAVSLLSLLLISEWEMNLIFIGILGWYPMVRPRLQRLKPAAAYLIKFAGFNVLIIGIETLVMRVLAPETESAVLLAVLLAAANLVFFLYDRLLPRYTLMLQRRLNQRRPT